MKNKFKKIMLFTFLSIISFSLFGCAKTDNITDTDTNNKIVGIRGIVTDITVDNNEGNILVEGSIEEDTTYDKASVTITEDTIIQKGSLNTSFQLKDIKLGDKVEVVFKGPVAESYPVQGNADIVRIISE